MNSNIMNDEIAHGNNKRVCYGDGCTLKLFLTDMREYMVEKTIDGTLDSDMNIAFKDAVEYAEGRRNSAELELVCKDYRCSSAWRDIAINWVGNADGVTFEYLESSDNKIAIAIYKDEICPSIQLYMVSSWYEFLVKSKYLDTLLIYFNDYEDRDEHLNWMSEEELELLSIANTHLLE